jgi:hypothetical protein
MLNSLLHLGLSKHEARIYLAVLKHGPCTAGPLVKETRLHRVFVYNALKSLKDQKLISMVVRNNRQNFQATNPESLLEPLREKARVAQLLIPELKGIMGRKDQAMGVRVLYGREGFWENLQEVIESAKKCDGIMRIIGGAPDTDFYKAIGPHYQAYKIKLKESKVAKWLLSPYYASSEFRAKFAKETTENRLKTLPAGLSSPTYTRITPEMVSIEIYTTPIFIIQIKNKAIASSYLEHFNLLWKQA